MVETSSASAQLTVFSWWDARTRHLEVFGSNGRTNEARVRDAALAAVLRGLPDLGRMLVASAAKSSCGFIIGVTRPGAPPEVYARIEFEPAANVTRELVIQEALSIAGRAGSLVLREAILRLSDQVDDGIRIGLANRTVFAGPKAISVSDREFDVLSAIALNRRGISTDAIVDRIWPDCDESKARACFRVLVHRIRARAGRHDLLLCEHGRWTLGRAVSVDLWAYERLLREARAVQLGPALRADLLAAYEELRTAGASASMRSVLADEIERGATGMLRKIAALLVEDALVRGDTTAVLEIARGVMTVDPYAEVWHESIVKAHLRTGNDRAAQSQLAEYATLLDAELGIGLPKHFQGLLEAAPA